MCDRRSYFEQLVKIFFTTCNHFAVIIEVKVFCYVFKTNTGHQNIHILDAQVLWPNTGASEAQDTWTFSIKHQKNFQLFTCEHGRFRWVCLHCIQITLLRNAFHRCFIKKLTKIFRGFRYAFTPGMQIRSDWRTHLHLGFVVLFEELWTWVVSSVSYSSQNRNLVYVWSIAYILKAYWKQCLSVNPGILTWITRVFPFQTTITSSTPSWFFWNILSHGRRKDFLSGKGQ